MADLSIFFNAMSLASSRLKKPQRVVIDTIEIDCTLSETHSFNSEISEFEVESGFDISDNRRLHPVEFTITGIISDTPPDRNTAREIAEIGSTTFAHVSGAGNQGAIIAQIGVDALANPPSIQSLTDTAVISSYAFDKLVKLFETGRDLDIQVGSRIGDDPTFTIVTRYQTYTNMIMRSLSIPRDRHTGDALIFSASFREIKTVQSENVDFFMPNFLQDPTSFGQVGTDPASQALKDNGSMLWQGGNYMTEDKATKVRDSLEKFLGIKK